MPSPVPTVREVAWISVVPHLIVLALLIFAASRTLTPGRLPASMAAGAGIYLAYSQIFRRLVTMRIRRGYRLLKKSAFTEAIAEYQRAYEFFSRHAWIDRFRYLTVLSSSAYTYREIALCSIAFAYAQIGDGTRAVETYRRALEEFPTCAAARTALKAAEAMENRGLRHEMAQERSV